jgi:hypothetical protein
MRTRWSWWIVSAVLAAGCGELLGIDDFEYVDGPSSPTTGSSASSATSTSASSVGGAGSMAGGAGGGAAGGSGGDACDLVTHACVADTPVDWNGPIAVHTGPDDGTDVACSGSYGAELGEFHVGLVPGNAICNCECGAAQNIQCTSSANVCYASGCVQACFGSDGTLPPGQCTAIPSSIDEKAKVSDPAPTNVGSCAPQSSHVLPTPTWATAVTACGGAAPSKRDCDDGDVCAPLPADPFQQTCIYRGGEHDCPEGFYTAKQLAYTDFTNTRSCSPCACGIATSQCNGNVIFAQSNCTVLLQTIPAGNCADKNLAGSYPTFARYTPAPSGSCQASGGVLSGSVTPTSPITLCCAP